MGGQNQCRSLYSIVSLPQNGPLDEKENFEKLMQLYQKNFIKVFGAMAWIWLTLNGVKNFPYSNKIRPTLIANVGSKGRANY
ncbi:MAG: hypothetical protein Ct9H300mP23_09860 [Nitrospinota bacterium]|nr:MAG: hypothetical protein Ct9H300mP23_09860 [Nitrospinota bacterium]